MGHSNVKDTLASDSWAFWRISDILEIGKKSYHHVWLVKKFLFPYPEIRLRHPLLRNRRFRVSKNSPTYSPSDKKGMNCIPIKMVSNHPLAQIVDT